MHDEPAGETCNDDDDDDEPGESQPSSLCARLMCWGHHVQSRVQGYAMCTLIIVIAQIAPQQQSTDSVDGLTNINSTADIPCEVCCRRTQHQEQPAVVHAGPQLSKQQAARHASITAPPSCKQTAHQHVYCCPYGHMLALHGSVIFEQHYILLFEQQHEILPLLML
jgi:hypothetical protein